MVLLYNISQQSFTPSCIEGDIIITSCQVLRQLELRTGAKVTEIFDWIVGTSTGGILALGLVYGNKTQSPIAIK